MVIWYVAGCYDVGWLTCCCLLTDVIVEAGTIWVGLLISMLLIGMLLDDMLLIGMLIADMLLYVDGCHIIGWYDVGYAVD